MHTTAQQPRHPRHSDRLDITEAVISDKRLNRIMNALESIATSLYVANVLTLEARLGSREQAFAALDDDRYSGDGAYQILLDSGYLGPENVDREIAGLP